MTTTQFVSIPAVRFDARTAYFVGEGVPDFVAEADSPVEAVAWLLVVTHGMTGAGAAQRAAQVVLDGSA